MLLDLNDVRYRKSEHAAKATGEAGDTHVTCCRTPACLVAGNGGSAATLAAFGHAIALLSIAAAAASARCSNFGSPIRSVHAANDCVGPRHRKASTSSNRRTSVLSV